MCIHAAPFPQQDTQHKEQALVSSPVHSALLHVKRSCSDESLQTLFSEDMACFVSKNLLLADSSLVILTVFFACAECPEGECGSNLL